MQSTHLLLSNKSAMEPEILNEQIVTDTLVIEENQNELDPSNRCYAYCPHLLTNLSEVSEELISTDKIAQVVLKDTHHHIDAPAKVPQKHNTDSDEILQSESTINEEGQINQFYDSTKGSLLLRIKDLAANQVVAAKSIEDSKYSIFNPLISENTVPDNIKAGTPRKSIEDKKIKQSEKLLDRLAFNEFTTNSSSRECYKKEKLDLQIDLRSAVRQIEEKNEVIEKQRQSALMQVKQEALHILMGKDIVDTAYTQRRNSNYLQRAEHSINGSNMNYSFQSLNRSDAYNSYHQRIPYNITPSNSVKCHNFVCNSSYCNRKQIIHALSFLLLVGETNSHIRHQIMSIFQKLDTYKNVVILIGKEYGKCEYRGSYVWNTNDSVKLIHSHKKCPSIIYSSMIKNCYHYDCSSREFKISNIPWLSAHTDAITLEYV